MWLFFVFLCVPSTILHSIHPAEICVKCCGEHWASHKCWIQSLQNINLLRGFTPCPGSSDFITQCRTQKNPVLPGPFQLFLACSPSFASSASLLSSQLSRKVGPRCVGSPTGSLSDWSWRGSSGRPRAPEACWSSHSATLPAQALGSSTHSLGKLEEGNWAL